MINGGKATRDAYGVSRSTVYEWKKRYRESKYDPKSLLPLSKRPKRVRRSNIDPLIIEFIRKLRFVKLQTWKIKDKGSLRRVLYTKQTSHNIRITGR